MKRALLESDFQREYFENVLLISYPVGYLENVLEGMDRAGEGKVPTAVNRCHQADPASPVFQLNSDMWRLHDKAQQRPRDVLIDK